MGTNGGGVQNVQNFAGPSFEHQALSRACQSDRDMVNSIGIRLGTIEISQRLLFTKYDRRKFVGSFGIGMVPGDTGLRI